MILICHLVPDLFYPLSSYPLCLFHTNYENNPLQIFMCHNQHNTGCPCISPVPQSFSRQSIKIFRASAFLNHSTEFFCHFPDKSILSTFLQSIQQKHRTRRPDRPSPIAVSLILRTVRTLCCQSIFCFEFVTFEYLNHIFSYIIRKSPSKNYRKIQDQTLIFNHMHVKSSPRNRVTIPE